MSQTKITRTQAADIIDRVASLVAQLEDGEFKKEKPADIANRLRTILSTTNVGPDPFVAIPIPTKCKGAAHSNPLIDHCSLCMPSWGWITSKVKVK